MADSDRLSGGLGSVVGLRGTDPLRLDPELEVI